MVRAFTYSNKQFTGFKFGFENKIQKLRKLIVSHANLNILSLSTTFGENSIGGNIEIQNGENSTEI